MEPQRTRMLWVIHDKAANHVRCLCPLCRVRPSFLVRGLHLTSSSSVGIVLAFTIPRVPDFLFPSNNPLKNATESWSKEVPTIFSRSPANFSFPAAISMEFNTGSNYLPIHMSKMVATVSDLTTGRQVGVGNLGATTLPAKAYPVIDMPLNFTYIANNDSDITCMPLPCDQHSHDVLTSIGRTLGADFYNGCRNPALNANGTRPGMLPYHSGRLGKLTA